MKYPIWKPLLIVGVIAACFVLLWPPEQKLKPGLDLAGGTTLIYDVRVPDNADASQVIDDLINVLRDRVDPTGTRNLIWRQIAGNRIEIQMALATPEAKQRRQAYLNARQALLDGNLTPGALNAALSHEGEAREAALQELAGGNEDLLADLRALATAHDAFVAASEPYHAAQQAYDEARAQLDALPADAPESQRTELEQRVDQLLQDLIPRAEAYNAARQARDAAEAEVLALNVEPVELERALNTPIKPSRPNKPTRAELVQQLKEKYPPRADQIEQVVQAYNAYEEVKGPLDDPNDLIALLQGSGVLEFRIAAPLNLPDAQRYRVQLAERGPRAGTDLPWRWFPVDDIDQFVDDARGEAALAADPASFFASRGLIGQAFGDDYYVLLGNTPDRAMTRDQNWELSSASRGTDQLGRNAVNFTLNAPGGDLMGAITGAHVGQQMAILLDNRVISAPQLNDKIQARGIITGSFTDAELTYLLRTLKAGSSEAELSEYPISIKTTGPQLGQDNLASGIRASVYALIAVGVFVAGYYFVLGLFADFALLVNMIIILGVMAMFEATFTLPGIAGIVLTIGMSVDANVLVFERIREELARKADVATAVRLGFQKAMSAIIDSNVTTLITCVILFYTATADVKGFAVTLMIGLVATLFTALFCTHVLIDLYLLIFKPKSIHMLPTAFPAIDRLLTPNIDWIGHRWLFLCLSVPLFVICSVAIFLRGGDMLDIEFRSGTQVSFTLDDAKTLPIDEVRERLRVVGELADRVQEGQPIDAAALTPLQQELLPQVRALVADAQKRFEGLVAEARKRQASGVSGAEAPDAPPDFGLLAEANVVTEGSTDAGHANGFSVVTLITDSQAVSDAIKIAFSDVLTTTRPIDFAGLDQTIATTDAVFPITTADLGRVINRAGVTAEVPDYLGGVAIVLDDLQPAATLQDLQERIRRIRLQPAYEELGFRPFEVYGIGAPVGTANGDARLYRSAVVVVRDRAANYAENPNTLREPGGLAATEWELVKDALQRDTSLASVSNFSSQVSDTMKQEAIVAITLSMLAVIIYIWFRFGSFAYSLAAIISTGHDIVIATGLAALSGYVYDTAIGELLMLAPFKINLTLIAALLTIVGYSINDTIVISDRIRENRGRLSYATPQIINDAINQTLSRTMITSGTTLLAVIVLYLFAGPGVHGFAFVMLIGVLVGTYSSIAIVTPIILAGANRDARRAAAQRGTTAPAAQPAT